MIAHLTIKFDEPKTGENIIIKDYLKAGYPALSVLTYEPSPFKVVLLLFSAPDELSS
jgi:hypothetical protein